MRTCLKIRRTRNKKGCKLSTDIKAKRHKKMGVDQGQAGPNSTTQIIEFPDAGYSSKS